MTDVGFHDVQFFSWRKTGHFMTPNSIHDGKQVDFWNGWPSLPSFLYTPSFDVCHRCLFFFHHPWMCLTNLLAPTSTCWEFSNLDVKQFCHRFFWMSNGLRQITPYYSISNHHSGGVLIVGGLYVTVLQTVRRSLYSGVFRTLSIHQFPPSPHLCIITPYTCSSPREHLERVVMTAQSHSVYHFA